jgi:hypothetical protein
MEFEEKLAVRLYLDDSEISIEFEIGAQRLGKICSLRIVFEWGPAHHWKISIKRFDDDGYKTIGWISDRTRGRHDIHPASSKVYGSDDYESEII